MAADLGLIHRWVAPRPGYDRTLLLLHGTGGNENDLIPLGWELAPGAGLLSPRGAVLEEGMPRFFRRISPGVFDVEDLRRRTDELAAFLARAAEQYGFDPRRVIAVGYSNGANIAASLLLLHPGALAGAVLFRPMIPFTPDPLPDLSGLPVRIAAARDDLLVPPAQSEALAELLRAAGAEVDLVWQPGGHALGRTDVTTAAEWLASIGS
ncbi:MAG TPA: alpha/beta hydrolase [Gemmatimonadales bacterium]|nr:alpha/beta hydrolase [Gemmatimonadales bacterium]